MSRFVVLAAVAFLATAVLAKDELVWESLFPPPFVNGPPQETMAIRCVNESLCYVPGASNGVGPGVYKFDGKRNGAFIKMTDDNMTLMELAITVGGTATEANGAFGGVGFLGQSAPLQYLKDGKEWTIAKTPFEFFFIVQSIHSTHDGKHVVALGMGPMVDSKSKGAAMVSHDAGASYTELPINVKLLTDNCTFPNYMAMVNDTNWFLTLGGYPGIDANNNNNNPTNPKKFRSAKDRILERSRLQRDKKKCPFTGQIAKTTDGGKTWTSLFSTEDFTITKIACSSAQHCVTAVWGKEKDGTAFTGAYTTMDGGATWKRTLTLAGDYALNAVDLADAQEVWIGGGYIDKQSETAAAVFWSSKDGGLTWTMSAGQPNLELVMSMSFSKNGNGVGFAVAMSEFKTSTVLRYKKQEFDGYFTQVQCPIAGCSILCRQVTFPQGMCLPAPGGSARAYCSATDIVQHSFDTTSCIGSFNTSTMPINQCLNGTNVFFKNLCNTTVPVGSTLSQEAHYRI